MKRYFTCVIVFVVCLGVLAGCGAGGAAPAATEAPTGTPAETEPEQSPVSPMVGGWAATEDAGMTDAVTAIFDKAMEGLLGVDYQPVAYLARQVVSGTNHAILCTARAVRPDAQPYYAMVFVYEDLSGNVERKNIVALTPYGEVDENAGAAGAMVGGWSIPETDEEGLAAFESAVEGLTGVSYTPVRVMSSQVVSGTNYCVLCRAQVVYPGAEPYYALVFVYKNLSGETEISRIEALDIPAMAEMKAE